MAFLNTYSQYITITCLEWKSFLKHDACKRIIIDALIFRVMKEQVKVYGFVIMPNHIHLIWKICDEIKQEDFQRDFLKYTAKSILVYLKAQNDELYSAAKVQAADREFQIWERNSLSKDLYTDLFFDQKLAYIHNNPIQDKWNLAKYPEDYYWSSASFYHNGDKRWPFLTHCDD